MPFRGIPRHDSASMVDVPPAITVAGGDRRSQRIVDRAAFGRRVDSGMRTRVSEIAFLMMQRRVAELKGRDAGNSG